MKQFTSDEQTAKLIELGLEKPKSIIEYSYPEQSEKQQAYEASLGLAPYLATVDQIKFEYAYSIGELIEMLHCLPMAIDVSVESVVSSGLGRGYGIYTQSKELIDALFEQIVKLKDEEVLPAK